MSWQTAFVTIHPKIIEAYRDLGVFRAAEQGGFASIAVQDLRDFACDKHASVDSAPFGGGDGMVLRPDCLANACESVFNSWGVRGNVVYTTPSGKIWNQDAAADFASMRRPTIFICGRFAGVDQRFIDSYVTHEFSVGDVVLAGGELPCLMMLECSLRLIDGVLGNHESAAIDSFGEALDGLLEAPNYARPQLWNNLGVPEVLLSGNHERIKNWRKKESLAKTKALRPDLINKKGV